MARRKTHAALDALINDPIVGVWLLINERRGVRLHSDGAARHIFSTSRSHLEPLDSHHSESAEVIEGLG